MLLVSFTPSPDGAGSRLLLHIGIQLPAHLRWYRLQRWRRRKNQDRQQTLQQQTLFSHKANPMYDTTQTLTTTSSSRGDDFEVIRVPPGQPPIQENLFPDATGYMPPVFMVSCMQLQHSKRS